MKNFTAILTLGLLASGAATAFADEHVDDNFTKSAAKFDNVKRTSPVVADFTNNGFLDVFYGGQENNQLGDWYWQILSNFYKNNGETFEFDGVNVYENGGEKAIAAGKHGVIGSSYNKYGVLDFNNDGNVDLLLWGNKEWDMVFDIDNKLTDDQKNYGFIFLYKNNGDGTFDLVTEAEFPAMFPEKFQWDNNTHSSFYNCIAIGDYDRDGYVDILLSANTPSPMVKLYRNIDGTGRFEEKTFDGFNPAGGGNVHFADLNNDGWLDIIADSQNQSTIYLNQEGKSFKLAETSPAYNILRNSSSSIADFDGDGYLDYFMTGYGPDWEAYIIINSTPKGQYTFDAPFKKSDTGLWGEENAQHIIRDFNGDGILDILYTTPKFDGCPIYYGTESGQFLRATKEVSNRVYMAAGDFNGNGLSDLFACGGNNKYERTDGSWTTCPELFLNVNAKVAAPAAPENVVYSIENCVLTISWDDVEGAAAKGLAYNVYVKKTDGSIITLVPANPETGFVKVGEGRVVALRPGVTEYTLPCADDAIESAGVQVISVYNETYSPFAVAADLNAPKDEIEHVDVEETPVEDDQAAMIYIQHLHINWGENVIAKHEDTDKDDLVVTATPVDQTKAAGDAIVLDTEIVENKLKIDVSGLEAGTYNINVPTGYLYVGDNGINKEVNYELTTGTPKEPSEEGDDTTGIEGISSAKEVFTVYNLQGVKVLSGASASEVNGLRKGVYIVNGKKVIIGK